MSRGLGEPDRPAATRLEPAQVLGAAIEVCGLEQRSRARLDTLRSEDPIMSASHHPTDIHLRQQRKKKRNRLRARIAAAAPGARAALEARVQRTYSPFHRPETKRAQPPPDA
jgi:hypothetical protein